MKNEPAIKPSTPLSKSRSKIYKKRIHSVTNTSESKPRCRECKDLIIEPVNGEENTVRMNTHVFRTFFGVLLLTNNTRCVADPENDQNPGQPRTSSLKNPKI